MNDNISSVVFFWVPFVIISGWVLNKFYFSKDPTSIKQLKLAAGVLEISLFILLFFPWLPGTHGATGWGLILQGSELGMTALFILIFFTAFTLFFKNSNLVKAGVIIHIAATVLLFGVMVKMMPGTVKLAMIDTAPIFAALIMLVNVVVLLLLWNELQKNKITVESN